MTVGDIEEQILAVEGFRVHFSRHDGGDRRSDFAPDGLKPYPYAKAAKASWTVAEWERARFAPNYPGFSIIYRTSSGLPLTSRQTSLRRFREL